MGSCVRDLGSILRASGLGGSHCELRAIFLTVEPDLGFFIRSILLPRLKSFYKMPCGLTRNIARSSYIKIHSRSRKVSTMRNPTSILSTTMLSTAAPWALSNCLQGACIVKLLIRRQSGDGQSLQVIRNYGCPKTADKISSIEIGLGSSAGTKRVALHVETPMDVLTCRCGACCVAGAKKNKKL